jgi:hypothetical protein
MKPSWISRSLLSLLPLVMIALLWGHDISLAGEARTQAETSAQSVPAPQQLSAEGQASLRAIIQARNLSDLRWPDFSDYSQLMTEFYQSYGYSLPWVRGMEPSAQAQQVIAILKNADQEDYSQRIMTGRVGATGWQNSSPPLRSHPKQTLCDSTLR